MRDECVISRALLEKQTRVFRIAESRGISVAVLAAETGISEHTLRSYCDKPSRPASMMPLSAFVKLAKALPSDLANILIEDSGFALKPRECGQKDWMAFAERTAAFSAKVCRYQATDNKIDHREDADLMDEARQIAAEAMARIGA